MTKWMPVILPGFAVALLVAALAWQGSTQTARAQSPVDQISIDMNETGNGAPAVGDRNGDGLADAEGYPIGVCGAGPAFTGDSNDDDADTVVDDGCPGSGVPATAEPEGGICDNDTDDDVKDVGLDGTITPFLDSDGTADDGCVETLSSQETCVEIIDNGSQDADEDAVDRLNIDITIGAQPGPGGGIPGGEALTAFQYNLNWDVDVMDVISKNGLFLIVSGGAGAPFSDIAATPQTTTPFSHGIADAGPAETGPGVLSRVTVEGNAAGLATLTLSNISLKDLSNADYPITAVNDGTLLAVSSDTDGNTTIDLDETFSCPTPTDVEVTTVTTTAPANGTAGTPFDVMADVDISNNSGQDPVLVDTTIQLNLPSDCTTGSTNPVVVQNTSLGIAASPVSLAQQTWSVTCTDPSNHNFTTTATVAIDASETAAFDGVSANNSLSSAADTTAVSATSDLSVEGVTVSGPAGLAIAGQAFNVTATVAVGNAGPFGPAEADVTSTLTLPGDCSTGTANPQTIDNSDIAVSPPDTDVAVVWSVTCTNSSDHSFSADGSVAVDQLHVTDGNGANDGPVASSATNIEVYQQTDVEVTTVTVVGAASEAINTAFNVTADVALSNLSGVDPANVDTTITLSLPADCSTADTNPVAIQDTSVSLAGSPVALAQQTWSVTCTQPSMHTISVDAAAAIDMVHVADSDSANNTKTGATLSVITAETDVQVVGVTLTAPTAVEANEAFDAEVDASLLNNGPFGPVSTAATVTLNLPTGCTSEPEGDRAANGISLAVDTPTAMPQQMWSVTCTQNGSHSFSADVVLAIDQNHVTDIDDGNDSGSSAVLAVAVGPAGFGALGGPPLGGDGQGTWPILIPIGLALALGMGLLGQRHRSKLSRRS